MGHWVELYHTFQGGCSGQGDYGSDTPAVASPTSGCPTGQDTCSSAVVDSIRKPLSFFSLRVVLGLIIRFVDNYTDHTDDARYEEFTPGQTTRLKQQLATYRGI